MWLTKKILCPTDFGDSSREASEISVELAQRFHVPLLLMHVFPIPKEIYYSVPFVPMDEHIQWGEEAARSHLEAEATRLRAQGIEVSSLLKMGSAWGEIIIAAKTCDVGLIVMGTHGRRGILRAFLGSVAEKVVRLSPVPVLTIHGDAQRADAATSTSATKHA
jgi:nucleotide-binding universal stress UspA family protein